MDNVFMWNRFALLTRRHFSLNFRTYLIGGVVLAGVMLLFSGLVVLIPVDGQEKTLVVTATYMKVMPVLIGGLIGITGGILQGYQRRWEATFNLLLPASTVETYALAWLVSLVFYTIGATAVFFAILPLGALLMELQGYTMSWQWSVERHFGDRSTWASLLIYLLIHAFALFGSMAFRKHALLKITAVVLLLSFGITVMMLMPILESAVTTTTVTMPDDPTSTSTERIVYSEASNQKKEMERAWLWFVSVSLFLTLSLWTTTYFKLKNKRA